MLSILDDVVQVYLLSDGHTDESFAAAIDSMARGESRVTSESASTSADCAQSVDTEDSISISEESEMIRGIINSYTGFSFFFITVYCFHIVLLAFCLLSKTFVEALCESFLWFFWADLKVFGPM